MDLDEMYLEYSTSFKEWLKVNKDLYNKSYDFIKSALEKYHKLIEISDDYPVCVPYDGGSHPEYASNCYSGVIDVHLDGNGKVVLYIDDCEEYEADRLNAESLSDVALSVYQTIEKDYGDKD